MLISVVLQLKSAFALLPLVKRSKHTEWVNELTEESSKYAFVVSMVLSVLGVSFLLLHFTEKTLRDHIQIGTGLYVYIYLLGVSVIQFWHRCNCII